MTQFQSDKIKVLSLFAILLVLYIHSGFHETANEIEGMSFNIALQHFISDILGGVAVPLFFMISGYLFFRNVNTLKDVWNKMKKRVRTLIVPFFFAALYMPLFLIVMESIPYAVKYMNGGGTLQQIQDFNLIQNLSALFYKVPNRTSPWAFQLWFLRDLIILVMSAPCLFIIKKYVDRYVLYGGVIFALITFIEIPVYPIKSMFWFMFGAVSLSHLNKVGWISPLLIYIAYWGIIHLLPGGSNVNEIEHIARLSGAIALWNYYDAFVPQTFNLRNNKWLLQACGFTFFIYLYHEPTLNVVRKLLVVPLGRNSLGFAMSYMLSPWIFVLLAIGVGIAMRKYCTRLFSILVGGR